MAISEELKLVIKAETQRAVMQMKQFQQHTDTAKRSVGEMQNAMFRWAKGMLTAGGVVMAIRATTKVIKDLYSAYAVQEQAEESLRSAIRATGRQYSISADSLIDFAGELQKVTRFGDEATISAISLLQQLANLDEEGIKQVVPGIQDMATAMGMDLNMAASLVGKTLGSTTNALSRYGIVVDMSGTKQDKLLEITTQLQEKFGGLSQDLAQTATGAVEQLTNAIGDLKEANGQLIAYGLEPTIRKLTRFAEAALEAKESLLRFAEMEREVRMGTATANEELQVLNEQIERLSRPRGRGMMAPAQVAELEALKERRALLREAARWEAIAADATEKAEREKADAAAEAAKAEADRQKQLQEYLKLVQTEYAKTEQGQREALEQAIAYWEDQLPYAVHTKDEVTAILAKLRKEYEDAYGEEAEEKPKKVAESLDMSEDALRRNQAALTDFVFPMEAAAEAAEELADELERIESVDPFAGAEDVASAYTKALSEAKDKAVELADTLNSYVAPVLVSIGEAIVEGEGGWKVIGDAAKDAISKILRALGQEALARSVIAFATGNFVQGSALAAAAAAAFVGSGIVASLAEGGVVTQHGAYELAEGNKPEAVIPLNKMGGLGTTIIINGSVLTEDQAARKIISVGNRLARGY